jgi:adenylate cyclase
MRQRFRSVSLCVSTLCIAFHWWADSTPVTGGIVHSRNERSSAAPIPLVLRAVHFLEGRATDLQFLVRGRRAPHPDVVVAVVDEKSAQRFGRWPWSRALVARALSELHQAGARSVGLDVMFLDQVEDAGQLAYQDSLGQLERVLADESNAAAERMQGFREFLIARAADSSDRQLAAAIERMPELTLGVVAYPKTDADQFAAKMQEQARILEPHLLRQISGKVPGSRHPVPLEQIKSWQNYSAQTPIALLAAPAKHLAHINAVPDPDGTLRRTPAFTKLDSPPGLLPILELQVAARYLDGAIEPVFEPQVNRLVAARLRSEKRSLVLDVPLQYSEPYSLINYPGPAAVFKTVSLSDIIDRRFVASDVSGKAVLIGVSLVGEYDQRVTPFSEMEPGIFSHASFLSNILSSDFLRRPEELRLLEMLFILLAGALLCEVLPRARYSVKLLVSFGIVALWLCGSQALFNHGLKFATAVPLLSVLAQSFVLVFLGYFSVDAEKAQLRSAFRYYLNESVMKEMLDHPERLKLGGEKKEMTVLFADIRGFTALSEQLVPESLVRFINSYLTPMTQIVFEEGGTLDKYIGDALMAFWGAPIHQEDHALRACRAALRFLDALGELNRQWSSEGLPQIEIGIGISSGPMVVGNMGSDIRFNYTVMGDAVNVAARLEAANKEHATRLLISESTYRAVQDSVEAEPIGGIKVRGRQAPVRVFELRGLAGAQEVSHKGPPSASAAAGT